MAMLVYKAEADDAMDNVELAVILEVTGNRLSVYHNNCCIFFN